jgi:hypothetical protein
VPVWANDRVPASNIVAANVNSFFIESPCRWKDLSSLSDGPPRPCELLLDTGMSGGVRVILSYLRRLLQKIALSDLGPAIFRFKTRGSQ